MKTIKDVLEGLVDGDITVDVMIPIIRMFSDMKRANRAIKEKVYRTNFSKSDWQSDSNELIKQYCKEIKLHDCNLGDWIIVIQERDKGFKSFKINFKIFKIENQDFEEYYDYTMLWSPKKIAWLDNHNISFSRNDDDYKNTDKIYKIVDEDIMKMFDDAWKKYYGR